MVYEYQLEQQNDNYDAADFGSCTYGSCTSSSTGTDQASSHAGPVPGRLQANIKVQRSKRPSLASIQVPAYEQQPAFMYDQQPYGDWSSIAEATMPLKTSQLLKRSSDEPSDFRSSGGSASGLFQASLECRSKEISRRLIWINLISLLINLSLAVVAFYFSFVNNSSSTSAFAADCVLDFISSAIVLWRYYGDLNSVLLQAREQIACIYLGALFEISAVAIIIKAATDIASGSSLGEEAVGYDLVYLSIAATIAMMVLTVFKVLLYKTIRDKSILLDVINTVISTVFAMSIIMSQLLINVDASFWYMDPILSIVLAIFMAGFGLKVIGQNFHVLRPAGARQKSAGPNYSTPLTFATTNNNYESNLQSRAVPAMTANWQKSDHSSIAFL